jgi:phosphoglycerate dehydrogenase-like enzyme
MSAVQQTHVQGVVLITWPDFPDERSATSKLLSRAGLTIRHEPKLGDRSSAQMRELVAGAVAAIVSTDPFDAAVLSACPTLRVIARVGVGVDSIDLEAASAAGVAVTVTRGANESTAADHTVALMLAAVRRVAEHDAAVRAGRWTRTGKHAPWDLAGRTVGLVGFGRIGQLVARRLEGFDVDVIYADPNPPADGSLERVELPELLARADIVSIHTPLLKSTRGLIGAAQFAQMRPHAIVVNTSRGGVVDEQALLDALESGHLRAAALDVFESEPPRNARLTTLRNVVLTPHTAGISARSVEQMVGEATGSVLAVLAGEIPDGLINPDALARDGALACSGGRS